MTASTSTPADPNSASARLTRRFEAIIFAFDEAIAAAQRSDAGIGRLIEEASAHGLELAVLSAARVGNLDGRLAARPSGPGCLMLAAARGREVFRVDREGPKLAFRSTANQSDAAVRWIGAQLWRCGVAESQVLRLRGRMDALAAALEDQIARRRRGELPAIDRDPRWALTLEGDEPLLERARESILTIANGLLGTRGSLLVASETSDPAVVMSGVYARRGADTHLLAAPRWNALALDRDAGAIVRRVLDLHAGVLHQRVGSEDGLEAVLFCSLARPATAVLRVRDPSGSMHPSRPLEPPPGVAYHEGRSEEGCWMRVSGAPGSIAAAAHDRIHGTAHERVLDRVAGYEGAAHGVADEHAALDRVQRARTLGFDALLAEHRRAWADRWEDADVLIEGDPELQLAVRLAIFHLIASAADTGEAAVGARGLTGRAYHGHVFWDSDVYVLPFLAATHPQAARAMLEYRIRRLPGRDPRRPHPAPRRSQVSVGVRTLRPRRHPKNAPRPRRRADGDPHRRRSRSTSSPTSRGRPPATSTGLPIGRSPPAPDAS